jgi:hypothetical protein
MRQNEAEKEKVRVFADIVWETRARLDLDAPLFINAMLNIIGYSMPDDMDEEYMRDVVREIYRLFIFIMEDKQRHINEHM